MKKVALITGGTKGIGLATAKALEKAGATVYILSRHPANIPGLHHIVCDVSDEEQARAAVDAVLEREGRLDILINNASLVVSGALEFTENADAKRLMEINLYGVVNMTRAALQPMRAQGGGRIVSLSSVAGSIPVPFHAWYSVSKAALAAYTFALFNEVKQMGISACAVIPGDTRTNPFRDKITEGDDVYGGRIARSVAKMEKDEQNGMDPEVVGRFIARVALKKHVKPTYVIGLLYKVFLLLWRILPVRLAGYIVGKMYSGE